MSHPKHPEYAVEAVRLSSYSKWPTTVPQRPVILCDAGFFYAGFSDCVRCFSCGGGLRNWDDGDIPWIEHARWYQHCDFLRQRKGDLFIQMHRQDENQQESLPEAPTPSTFRPEQTNGEVERATATPSHEDDVAVKSVQEMGYSKTVIATAVETLKKQGKTGYTAMDLMRIILDSEDNGTILEENTEDAKGAQSKPTGASFSSADGASILQENRNLKSQLTCKICLEKDACIVFLPCGHMVSCQDCAPTIRKCCICRKLIQGTVRAYM